MEIIPSILEHKAKDYITQVFRLSPYLNHFQVDIADGILVPNKTANLEEVITLLTNRSFDKTENKHPQTVTNLRYDFHLMVSNPAPYIDYIKALKPNIDIRTVFIHYKALSAGAPFSFYTDKYSDLAQIGLVINPEEEVNTISKTTLMQTIPIVQIMTVIPGMQGSPFIIKSLKKIGQLRSLGYRNKISVDGGVNLDTIRLMISRNQIPDIVCPGSYFSKTNNLKQQIEDMNTLISSISTV